MKFENFNGETVDLDYNEFVSCTFRNCTLIYRGGNAPILTGNSFNNFSFVFAGAAGTTLAFLTSLYHGGFKPLIETTIDNIRTNSPNGNWSMH
jgi:hypothetical protein